MTSIKNSFYKDLDSFVNNNKALCILTLGLAIAVYSLGNLANRGVAWIIESIGTTKKTDIATQKTFNNMQNGRSPEDSANPIQKPQRSFRLTVQGNPANTKTNNIFNSTKNQHPIKNPIPIPNNTITPIPKQEHSLETQIRTSALRIRATELTFPDVNQLVSSLRTKFVGMHPDELRQIYSKHETDIIALRDLCRQDFTKSNIWANGLDSCNRQLLINEKYTHFLSSPKLIQALFALEAFAKVDSQKADLLHITKYNQVIVSIPAMIDFGLKGNSPLSLESLPLNSGEAAACYKKLYLTQKKSSAFVNLFKALGGKIQEKPKNSPDIYALQKWPLYKETILEPILTKIETENPAKLLSNVGGWSVGTLIMQARNGLYDLCKEMGIQATKHDFEELAPDEYTLNITFNELIERISTSTEILIPSISHNIDRLHLLAALIDKNPAYFTLNDGQRSLRDIYLGVFNQLAEDPIPERAVAAEQFYVRLQMIKERL